MIGKGKQNIFFDNNICNSLFASEFRMDKSCSLQRLLINKKNIRKIHKMSEVMNLLSGNNTIFFC